MTRAVDQLALLVVKGLLVHSENLPQHRPQLLRGQRNFPVPPKQHESYNSNIRNISHGLCGLHFSSGFFKVC